MKLRKDQEKAVEIIKESLENYNAVFFQAPTGWGKTAITVDIANHYRKQGKNIIIATVRNDLVSQFHKTIKRMGAVGEPTIVVGRSNYIILDNAIGEIGSIIEKDPNINVKEAKKLSKFLIKEKKTGKEYIFASDVEREQPSLTDTDIWNLIKFTACATQENNLPTLSNTPYVITNIFYLASYLIHSEGARRELSPNTVVLLDEVDYYAESIRNFFFTGFSLHNIKAISSYISYESNSEMYAKLAAKSENARDKIAKLSKKVENSPKAIEEVYSVLKKTFSKRFIKQIINDLNIPKPNNMQRELYNQMRELNRFLKEIEENGYEVFYRTGYYKISFSPIRKYPKITRQGKSQKDVRGYLYYIWENMTNNNNKVVGLGATIAPNFNILKNRGKMLTEVSKTLTLPSNFDYKFITIEDIQKRKKRNAIVSLAPENAPHFSYNRNMEMKQWFDYIGNTVLKTYKGNKAMIICRARETSQYIAKLLIDKGLKEVVYDQNSDMKKTLSSFMNKGGILVAHSGLGVGMDIPDIEQLYIAQLPFAPPKTAKNDKRDFIQWIGRLRDNARKEKELFILDSRIHRNRSMMHELKNYYKEVQTLSVEEKSSKKA